MQWWKLIGLAGVAGVAASGVVVARDQRKRNAYSPDEVRSRLHERAEAASSVEEPSGDAEPISEVATPEAPSADVPDADSEASPEPA
jgi:hypothetical protein